jgi:hypothetical protein
MDEPQPERRSTQKNQTQVLNRGGPYIISGKGETGFSTALDHGEANSAPARRIWRKRRMLKGMEAR